ncbi:MAG: mycofactocin biosynthesis glycosyltransferase MftF [Actinomycetales bacterium]
MSRGPGYGAQPGVVLDGPGVTVLPTGFRVRLSPHARRCDDGATLLGGSRRRVLRIRPAAQGRITAEGELVVRDEVDARLARNLLDRGFADPVWHTPPDGPDADRAVGDVTVVIPTLDRPDAVQALLATLPPGLAVIVVDDGSRDPDRVRAVAERHGALVLRHDTNLGPAAARNTGLRRVSTPLVAFVDSDITPQPGWLATLVRHFTDPAVAVAAPRVLGPSPDPADGWVERYEQARSSLDLGPHPALVAPGGVVSYLPSACLLARVEALGAGFEESMRVGEDVDLIWRLAEAGWRVRYEPTASVRHAHRAEFWPWLQRKAFYGSSAAELARRHRSAVAPMVLRGWSLALVAGALAQRRWSPGVVLAAYGVGTWRTAAQLRSLDHPARAAAVLTLEAAVSSLWQTGAGLTRHYWPVAVPAALVSRRARRALVVAAVADALADYRRVRPRLGPARYVVARRLDDLAYGAGLWAGAWRARSLRALVPDLGPRGAGPR